MNALTIYIIGWVLGCFTGLFLGLFIMCCLIIARRCDDEKRIH